MPTLDSNINSSPAINPVWRWAVPLFALILMAILWLTEANVPVFLWLNERLFLVGPELWNHLTILGEIGIVFMLPFFGRRPDITWQFVLAGLLATLWTNGLKSPLGVMRPPAVLHENFHIIGPFLEQHSFPSGHTTTIFLLAGVLCLQAINVRWKVLILLLALLVGLSRIACGVHWPMDVLGGMLGGWLAAVIGVALAKRWSVGEKLTVQRVFALIFLAAAIWFVAGYNSGQIGTNWLQYGLVLTSIAAALPGFKRLFWVKPRN